MDEVREFCRRVLGAGELADQAAAQASAAASGDRMQVLASAAQVCREHAELGRNGQPEDQAGTDPLGLAAAVANELALATAQLPERQREALALRELLGISHHEISQVMGIEPPAVAPLLARARLRLRSERRGTEAEPGADCQQRDRALRVLACRQDSEPVSSEDDGWLLQHLATCEGCDMAHAAMLEASVCYRAWPRGQ
jgi:Sigma-70, region 4